MITAFWSKDILFAFESLTAHSERVFPKPAIVAGLGCPLRRRLAVWLAIALTVVTHASGEPRQERWPVVDMRATTATVTPAAAVAEREMRALKPGLSISRHAITGAPRWIHSTEGFLTVPENRSQAARVGGSKMDPYRVVKAFVDEHRVLFGHGSEELARARIIRDSTGKHNGLHTTVWEQQHAGIPVFEGVFLAHVSQAGELVNVSSQFLADPAVAVANGQGPGWETHARLTPAQALGSACANVGLALPAGDLATRVDGPRGTELEQHWSGGILKGKAQLRLVWLPLGPDRARLAWEVFFMPRALSNLFRTVVDAETGAVLLRHNFTYDISDISLRVFTADSPTPMLPGSASPGGDKQPAAVARTLVKLKALDTTASPAGWIPDGDNMTAGNNVDAHSDVSGDNQVDLPRPSGSPARVFDFPIDLTQSPYNHRKAAIVNLFYWNNWMHDRLYQLGFDEASGNFQTDNFGRGGKDGDAVMADAQDGGGDSNANFSCPPDGNAPRMQMYIYSGPNPSRDGDFDTSVMLHEYTHGLSGRLVGGGAGFTALQTRGMGEGWSDFYALTLLAPASGSLGASYPQGAYSIYGYHFAGAFAHDGDNYYFGCRHYPYSTNLTVNPLTFRDISPDLISPHTGVPKSPLWANAAVDGTHHIGEVWCAMLWEARAAMILKHGHAVGNELILQLVTDGMKLSPPNPSFLEARDAILQADQVLDAGANNFELWTAFAKRGLGVDAASVSSDGTDIAESYQADRDSLGVPEFLNAAVTGRAGGPLTVWPTTLTLTNRSGSAIAWTSVADPLLTLSPASGSLGAHETVKLAVNVNALQATALPVGGPVMHTLEFSNRVSHARQFRTYNFTIQEPLELWSDTNGQVTASFSLSGEKGGPFDMRLFFLANHSDKAMPWIAAVDVPFALWPTAGTIPPHSVFPLTLAAGNAANALPYGHRIGEMRLTNQTTDIEQTASLDLGVRNRGYLTEFFNAGSFDLAHTRLTFTPNGSDEFYEVCRESVSGFSTDPSGGTPLGDHFYTTSLGGFRELDNDADVLLTGGHTVSVFGFKTNHVCVNLDGTLTFDGPNYSDLYQDRLRVSVAMFPYHPTRSGQAGAVVSWKQLSDRLAVTWQNVVAYYAYRSEPTNTSTNSFQAELFFNGTIRFTYLDIPDYVNPDVGLWRGGGLPDDFGNTDFSSVVDCSELLPPLTVTAPAVYTEGRAHPANEGRVAIPGPVDTNLVVHLDSNSPREIMVPAAVTIPAGATSAVFNLTVGDDQLLDGTQAAILTGTAGGFKSVPATVYVNDHEGTALHLVLPSTLTEGGPTYFPHVYTKVPVDDDVAVSLTASPSHQVSFGSMPLAIIPKGQTSALFEISAVDNDRIDGTRQVQVIASVANWTSATNTVTILDNEPTNLNVATTSFLIEGSGLLSNAAWVTLSGTLPTNLTVEVTCDNLVAVWALGPVVIPAGQTNAFFNLFVWDNVTIDPARFVTFTASAPGFTSGQWPALLLDNDGPPMAVRPSPANYAEDAPLTADLAWGPAYGELILNGGFESALANWTREDKGAGGWVSAGANYSPIGSEPALGPHSGSQCALSQQYGNGRHALWQEVSLPDSAWPIRLSWSQRVHNHAPSFATNQQFRVELRDQTNGVLATLFTTSTNDALMSDWTHQEADLWLLKGQTLRVAFVEEDDLGELNVSLDDVSLIATPPAPTTWLVYFGTAATPGNAQFQGATTNAAWPLGALATDTTYYWQVKSVRAGRTNAGPIWQFSTTYTTNRPPVINLATPAAFSVYRVPASIPFTFHLLSTGITNMEFYADRTLLGQISIPPWSLTWTNALPGEHVVFAVAQDRSGWRGTSVVNVISVLPSSGSLLSIVPFGSTWRYLDTGVNPAAGWRGELRSFYSDASWLSGPGLLGYGKGDEATRVDFGRDDSNKHITTYFRLGFEMNPQVQYLVLRVLRKDGVAVYLNGQEVLRDNLSASATYTTLATSSLSVQRAGVPLSASGPASLLASFHNCLAAEVHLARSDADSLAFDAELSAVMDLPPTVTFQAPAPNELCFQPTNLTLAAGAWAPYGRVTQVEFFADGASLGTVRAAPYTWTWTNAPVGIHALKAVATDGLGMTNATPDTLVMVLDPSPPVSLSPSGGALDLRWASHATLYHVEFATNMTPPVYWQLWTNSRPILTNSQFQLSTPPRQSQLFFRLAAP